MNEEFKQIVDNIKNGNEKSHVYHNDKQYKDKFNLMIKKYFTLPTTSDIDQHELANSLYKFSNGGLGVYDSDPFIQKFSKSIKLQNQANNINNTD